MVILLLKSLPTDMCIYIPAVGCGVPIILSLAGLRRKGAHVADSELQRIMESVDLDGNHTLDFQVDDECHGAVEASLADLPTAQSVVYELHHTTEPTTSDGQLTHHMFFWMFAPARLQLNFFCALLSTVLTTEFLTVLHSDVTLSRSF
jgi:hypothetical protein